MGVWDLWFGVWGVGFGVEDLKFRGCEPFAEDPSRQIPSPASHGHPYMYLLWGLWFMVDGLCFRVEGLVFGVES